MKSLKIDNKEFPAHAKNRKMMFWGADQGKKLAELDDSHLKIIVGMIKDKFQNYSTINGYSKDAWLLAIKTEEQFRNTQINILANQTSGKLRMVLKKLMI